LAPRFALSISREISPAAPSGQLSCVLSAPCSGGLKAWPSLATCQTMATAVLALGSMENCWLRFLHKADWPGCIVNTEIEFLQTGCRSDIDSVSSASPAQE